uniref:Uncharacterized protein n=1 Tax=Arundo donax TaxID=35708 RepID=A0A0A9I2V4_ARUDO
MCYFITSPVNSLLWRNNDLRLHQSYCFSCQSSEIPWGRSFPHCPSFFSSIRVAKSSVCLFITKARSSNVILISRLIALFHFVI